MQFENIATYKRKNAPGQGRKKEGRTASTIAMLPEVWDLIDEVRGEESRGKAIEKLIRLAIESDRRRSTVSARTRRTRKKIEVSSADAIALAIDAKQGIHQRAA